MNNIYLRPLRCHGVVWVILVLVVWVWTMPSAKCLAQGVLQEMRDEVRSAPADRPRDKPAKHKKRRSYDEEDEDENEVLGSFLGAMMAPAFQSVFDAMLYTISSPYWGPVVLANDTYQSGGEFALYPYEEELKGFMVSDLTSHEPTRSWSLRVRGEYADDFNSQSRFGGNVLWESANRVGIDTSFDYRRELLGRNMRDNLWTGDANLVFRFAQGEQLTVRSGLGMNWLSDTAGSDFGFNFTYGGDWFPRKPWIISSTIDWGLLGHATLFHGRATIGLNYRHWEVYTGYDYFSVGSAQINGLVSGVRFWY